MRYRLFHKPTRTVRAERYATEADAYAALGKMPFTESADYFVVVDDPTTAAERAGGYRRVKVSMEIIANLTQYPSQPVTMQIVDDAGDLQFVMTRHDCAPPPLATLFGHSAMKHCTDCRITYHNPDALVCYKCGENLT